MALVPFLTSPVSDYADNPFDVSLLNNELLRLLSPYRSGFYRPWARQESVTAPVQLSNNGFRFNIDVQQFKPEELQVKISNGYVLVEGKHEERSDQHGFIARQFTRKYKIPDDVDEKAIVSTLSSDGVLMIKAPKKSDKGDGVREIPITKTNEPAMELQQAEKIV